MPATSITASSLSAKEGTLRTLIRSALPLRHVAVTSTIPPGGSSTSFVSGSCIGTMPVSSSTVATQMALEPDMGGVSAGSMMIQPMQARGSVGGTSRLTCRNTPPRGSFRTKFRNVSSLAMNRDCSQIVSPGGGRTPPTITSPTSPSAWQETTWITFVLRIRSPRPNLGRQLREIRQQPAHAFKPLLRLVPAVQEHQLVVGAEFHNIRLSRDEADELLGIGELVVA